MSDGRRASVHAFFQKKNKHSDSHSGKALLSQSTASPSSSHSSDITSTATSTDQGPSPNHRKPPYSPDGAVNSTPPPPNPPRQDAEDPYAAHAPIIAYRTPSNTSTTTTITPGVQKDSAGRRDFATYTTARSMTLGHGGHVHDMALNPRTELQKLQDTTAKRIATLDYLRRTHEGTVHWLNTLHLTTSHLLSLPSFAPPKLARRAHNHLILGISLPTMLDPYSSSSSSALDYLRALNDILADYETYQTLHPPDGHSSNSLGRTRLPSMFKRSGNGTNKPRRSNTGGSGSEALSPVHSSSSYSHSQSYDYINDNSSFTTGTSTTHRSFSNPHPPPPPSSTTTSFTPILHPFTSSTDTSDPTETYTHLLTPHLPFTPSYSETFATLAEVLIDVYLTISRLVATPEGCTPGVVNAFQSADKRVRRLLVEGFVREVGEGVREGVRSEVAGVGRVVFGGLV